LGVQWLGVHETSAETSDERKVEERSAVGPHIVHEAIRRQGEEAVERSASSAAFSGLAAGLSMGFSLLGEALLHAHLPDSEWRPAVAKLGYTLGFVIVIMGRQLLFTENTLPPVVHLLSRRDGRTFGAVGRLWAVVLAANLAGALLFAAALHVPGLVEPKVAQSIGEVSAKGLEGSAAKHLLTGVPAGWLIALVAWMLGSERQAHVSVIVALTYVIGLAGFSHVIAGAVEVFHLAIIGAASVPDVLARFIVPALIGNTIGGVTLVAALNHAQVATNR
jgi:formate/nitrite transporter FocA (FNT family)